MSKLFQGIILVVCIFTMQMNALPLFAASRGLTVVSKEGKSIDLYKDYHAVVIGVSDYDYWPDLPHAVKDAQEVRTQLEKMGFTVSLVLDPDAQKLSSILTHAYYDLGREKDRALLFYFAGHGATTELADGTSMGYIIPKDCPLPDKNREDFDNKAKSMKDIEKLALQIKSRHVLMVFDSCFSGSLFNMVRGAVPRDITEKSAEPVRQFITAGKEDEEVPDMSVFKECFLYALGGDADLNKDRYITGTELSIYLDSKVINYSKGAQHPQYGKINNPKLDKGDFVFKLPGFEETVPKPAEEDKRFDTVATEREQEKKKWDEWQDAMEARYRKNQELDRGSNLTASEKAQMWGQFLANYATNNPYSTEDDKMRDDAKGRVEYWKGQHVNSKTEVYAENYNEPAVDMEFVFVRGGEYEMGWGDWAGDCEDDEKPVHTVKVDDFYMGRYEVTVGQWKKFIRDTGYRGDGINAWGSKGTSVPDFPQYDNHPVVCVSWNEAKAFADWLSGKTGKKYRLPTEAEWEYAARSRGQKVKYGTKTGDFSHNLVNYNGIGRKDQWKYTSPVGSFPANPLGLYDMTGNVWEWCSDWYGSDYYSNCPVDNPKGPGSGSSRVLRGCSWDLSNPKFFRSGGRVGYNPVYRYHYTGFRVSRTP